MTIALIQGPLYNDTHEKEWNLLGKLHNQVIDHFSVLGLDLFVDEAEGYACLRSKPPGEEGVEYPRLVARRQLSFPVSVLLALLRKRLAEFDASSSDSRLVMSRDQIAEMMQIFMPSASNEAKIADRIVTYIGKVVEMGFLQRLRGQEDLFEVRRIIKVYVDGQWLAEFDARLDEYLAVPSVLDEAL